MNLARYSINTQIFTWIVILAALLGGTWGFLSVGRLEDPAFTIKQAVVVTGYPGASAEQVSREVSEPLETAIQQMEELDYLETVNTPGHSLINVVIKSTYRGKDLDGIWRDLRNRVADAALNLPDGAQKPFVNDAFGDVFGLYYAVTAPGLSDTELHGLARFLRREILAVSGVANVEVSGLPEEAIFVEPTPAVSSNAGISPTVLLGAISASNTLSDGGSIEDGRASTRILGPTGTDSVTDIANLSISAGGTLVNVFDFATVTRGRLDTPERIIRHNGAEAFTLGIAGISTENIVEVGARVDARLFALMSDVPAGVELHPIYQQHRIVDRASSDFLISLAMSVAIVVLVLAATMGWRAAIVVGSTLLLTVVGTFLFMQFFAIDMERISLGALIIAMGMLVDNAIVVAEGMQVGMHRGMSSRDAAELATKKTQVSLLGATVIGIAAFAGTGLSDDATGEFMFSLFAVIAISLMLSWFLALTVTPLLGHYVFKRDHAIEGDPYDGAFFRLYGRFLRVMLKLRWLVVLALIAITAACVMGFTQVRQQFFPYSNTPLFYVHYQLPQGSAMQATSDDLAVIEDWLLQRDEVVSVTAFVGGPATRFMLTYVAEDASPTYGHMLVRTRTIEEIPALRKALEAHGAEALPGGQMRVARIVFGPGASAPIQARFSGPDRDVLRRLGTEAIERMQAASDNIRSPRLDWRERELVLRPVFADDRAQIAGVTREDVTNTLLLATDGARAGTYRENERLIPIIVRQPRDAGTSLVDMPMLSPASGSVISLEQMIEGLSFEAQDTIIVRRDRVPTIGVEIDIPSGRTAAEVQAEIWDALETMPLPFGYAMEWGGEYESQQDANEALASALPVSALTMVLISVLLFMQLRQPTIIWLLVPMSINGVVIGLLLTDQPFTFTALLGLLSLSGMLIKNGIVLVEEIDFERADGKRLEEAIVHASISRLRPVTLAAATTILGMTPLLGDAFFVSMAVTIMGGLTFASILTLVAAPVLYRMFFAREGRAERAADAGGGTGSAPDAPHPAPRPAPVPGTDRVTPGPLAPPTHVDVRL